jgi:hypothetical protein
MLETHSVDGFLNERPSRPRARPITLALAAILLAILSFGGGALLAYRRPTLTMVPGTPIAAELNSLELTGNRAFIIRLIRDLNAGQPASNSVTSCFSGAVIRKDKIAFIYPNGDELRIDVTSGCPGAWAIAEYSPGRVARVGNAVVQDLAGWPTT